MEQMDSAASPLGVDRLHRHRDRQLRRAVPGEAAELGDLFAAPPARAAALHRLVSVRAAVRRQAAERAARRLTTTGRSSVSPESSRPVEGEVDARSGNQVGGGADEREADGRADLHGDRDTGDLDAALGA